jgi:hypothetical protein
MVDLAQYDWNRLGWMLKIRAPSRLLTRVIYLADCIMPRRKLFTHFNDCYAEKDHIVELSSYL